MYLREQDGFVVYKVLCSRFKMQKSPHLIFFLEWSHSKTIVFSKWSHSKTLRVKNSSALDNFPIAVLYEGF